jgi:ArsR family transcriptional regulator, lead/cadmium/zinc/bismuth-responsive transcriptional repressor
MLGRARETCVCDVSWVTERAPNLVSHQLRVLRSAGLVRSRRDGKMVLYSLTMIGRLLEDLLDPGGAAEVTA